MVTRQFLFEGAVYALQNSGHLLRDAVALYDRGSCASAVVLALLAREELGKHGLLSDAFDKLAAGEDVELEDVLRACRNHTAKQARSQMSITQRFSRDDPIGKAVRAQMEHAPGTPEYVEAARVMGEARDRRMREAPGERHRIRLSALYVEPAEDRSGWVRPLEGGKDDAKHEVFDAVNDYSNVYDKLVQRNVVRVTAFMSAFHAWTDRPPILAPAWPAAW